MIRYRRFRNTDPPGLAEVWNETFINRGAVRLRAATPLEWGVFARSYFDPAGLIVAEEDDRCVGFAHAGFGPGPKEGTLATEAGVICLVGVRPAFRRRGIGAQLVKHCEEYLRQRGAKEVFAGPHPPLNPYYLGLYGGSDAVGFLASDPDAEPFFLHLGYKLYRTYAVLQRQLREPIKVSDSRFASLRQLYEVRMGTSKSLSTWWRDCQFGLIEPVEFSLYDKQTDEPKARALAWEMESFGERWNSSTVGLVDLEVEPELRRHGLGKFLLTLLLRHLQEQFFSQMEAQVPLSNTAGLEFFKQSGFEQIDVGHVFRQPEAK